ncbi:MAG: hypothetical protein ACXWCY_28785 [Burkholderiales bacterium]
MNIKTNPDGSFTIECDGHEVTISPGAGTPIRTTPLPPPTQSAAEPDPDVPVFPVPPRPRLSFVVPTSYPFGRSPDTFRPPIFYLTERLNVVGDWEEMRYEGLPPKPLKVVELRLRAGLTLNMEALRAALDGLSPAQVLLTVEVPETDPITRTSRGYTG